MLLLLLACRNPDPKVTPDPPNDACTIDDLPQTYAPSAPVTVRTDTYGIRHLYASSDADVIWAQGYAQALDRRFQLEVNLRSAAGTLSEIRGESARTSDIQARTIGFARDVCPSLRAIYDARPDDYMLLVAFAEGINAGTAALDTPQDFVDLGIQPTPWTVGDVMATGRRLSFGYSNTLTFDLLYTVMIGLTDDANGVLSAADDGFIMGQAPPAGPVWPNTASRRSGTFDPQRLVDAHRAHSRGQGSNNWAVSPEHSATGTTLLANDPHAGLNDPSLMYLVHLDSLSGGGSMDVIGFGFVGFPTVQLGHTRTIAWVATTNYADLLDLWDVPIDGETVTLGSETFTLAPIFEDFQILQDDGSFVTDTVRIDHVDGYGVLVTEDFIGLPTTLVADGALLMNWNGFGPITDYFLYTDLDRASTLEDFDNAILWQKTGVQNFVAATAEGWHYYAHGAVPDRGPVEARARANRVLDGTDASTFWTGAVLPESQLPRLNSDTLPYMQSANQDPWGHSADGDPTNDAFYYGGFFDPGFRGGRARDSLDTLTQAGDVTVDAMMAMQMDTDSPLARRLVPLLLAAWDDAQGNPDLADYTGDAELADAVSRLSAWDCRMVRDSREAALFKAFQSFLGKEIFANDLNILFDAVESDSPITLASMVVLAYETNNAEVLDSRQDQKMLNALRDAVDWVGDRTYTDTHLTRFGSPNQSGKSFPTDGDDATLNVSQCSFFNDTDPVDVCVSGDGPIFRQVTEFVDGTPVWWVTWPYGLDGDGQNWANGVYSRLWFSSEEVQANLANEELW